MLFTEYNEAGVMEVLREEAYEDGLSAGVEQERALMEQERSRADAAEKENGILKSWQAELEKKLMEGNG
ncbi:MAG: hypothetical protein K6F53_11765 [Lachnospiraceae bacterium]|nr:hypothetical protein [Lachnospiraceae bacterium]